MQNRKRKAPTQLSPYEKEEFFSPKDVELVKNSSHIDDSRLKTKILDTSYGGKFSKIFSETNLFPDLQNSDEIMRKKMSSLNECFIRSVKKVLDKNTSKNLTFLFNQYKIHLEAISKFHES